MGAITFFAVVLSLYTTKVSGAYRYNLESCSDLVPRHISDRSENYHESQQPTPNWRIGNGGTVRNKRESYNDSPFRITVPGSRYRSNTDLYVQIEGKGSYDAVMIQGRAVGSGGDFISGGVGLLGEFDPSKLDRRNFSYLECFRQAHSTVVDNGNGRLGNVSFIWTPPETDKGNIRFIGGITKGGHYWIIVSGILQFNPFPISTVQCGGAEACFRVCPLDVRDNLCGSDNAVLLYNYNTDWGGKREIEFTLGGKLASSQSSYIGVIYAEDNDNLYQGDVTVCYLQEGRAVVGHYYLEVAGGPLVQHTEEITIDDYDYDGNMLWCRYRRPINHLHTAVINPRRSFYVLLFRGELSPVSFPKLLTPSRSSMFSSDRRLNLSTPINEIYSSSNPLKHFLFIWSHVTLSAVLLFNHNLFLI